MATQTAPGVRRARARDADAIAAIFNEAVDERVATFQTWPAVAADFAARIAGERRAIVLVAELAGELAGFASVAASGDRPFYAGVGEYQVYVRGSARRAGIGAALLAALVDAAREAGYWKLIGKLFTTNAPSIELAHACGFRDVGVHLRHGQLDGEWRDVLLVERSL